MSYSKIIKVFVLGGLLSIPTFLFAQSFVPLTTIPGITDFTNASSLVNGIVRIVIVAGALLAVVQIIRGGFIYITTEAVSSKGDAKKLISDALTGLLLILGSVLILTVINPDILNVRFFTNERTRVGTDVTGDTAQGDGRVITEVARNTSCPSANSRYTFAGEIPSTSGTNKECIYTKNPQSPDGINITENGVVKTAPYIKEGDNIIIEVKRTISCPYTPSVEGKSYIQQAGGTPPGSQPGTKKCIYQPL